MRIDLGSSFGANFFSSALLNDVWEVMIIRHCLKVCAKRKLFAHSFQIRRRLTVD